MSFSSGQDPDERLMVSYLIGAAPEGDTERLDELSIVDDEVAARLRAVEHDLVDAYVKGELSDETRERFEVQYLASSEGRDKTRFAQALAAYDTPVAVATPPAPARPSGLFLRVLPQWGLPAAALLFLATAGILLVENQRLRRETVDSRVERAALQQREQQLVEQLEEQRSQGATTATELARVRESLAAAERRAAAGQQAGVSILAFLLAPATRNASDVTTIALPAGARTVRLRLILESDDFPRYQAALLDPTTDRVLWRSATLPAQTSAGRRIVSMSVPAGLLKPRHYEIALSGLRTGGMQEPLSSYLFRAVVK